MLLTLLAPTVAQRRPTIRHHDGGPYLAVGIAFDHGSDAEAGFTVSPSGVTSPVFTDVAEKGHEFSISQGRSEQLDSFQAGVATVKLANPDRRFDPDHAAGPYYGKVLPNVRLRIRAQWNGTDYDLFDGFVDDWPQEYERPSYATTTVSATDAFAIFEKLDLGDTPYVTEVQQDSPKFWWRLND